MKVKMVKMGLDIDETRNHRIRGIIPTLDNKYLFIEILQGNRIGRTYTNLSQKEYEKRYPNEEYIWVDSCFRVDIPLEYKNNYSPEFKEHHNKFYYEISHTKENIVKVLQKINPEIEDVELVDEYYIDKFCEEKGFFRLYDERLKHSYEPLKIEWIALRSNGEVDVKYLYTCYAVNGEEYKEEMKMKTTLKELINNYGKEKIEGLVNIYIKEKCKGRFSNERESEYKKEVKELFEKAYKETTKNIEEYPDI